MPTWALMLPAFDSARYRVGSVRVKAPGKAMNFHLTDEHQQFAESGRRFAQDHLAAGVLKRAHDPRFLYDVVRLMPKQRLKGIAPPERDGGQSASSRAGRSSIAALLKPLFGVMLPDTAELIALLPNFGAVLAIEAKLVGGPESDNNCYSENEDSLHFSGSPT
jgi:alkylation response protein AidB-like acyl-CoA dehydrogenase